MMLQMLFAVCSTKIVYLKDFDTNMTSPSHALDIKLQILFGRTFNLNWIPPKDVMQI